MSTLNKQIHDQKNGLTYTLCGDYYLPDLNLPAGIFLRRPGAAFSGGPFDAFPGLACKPKHPLAKPPGDVCI